ncbi:MAG: hypothetical protein QM796_13215 [Chthoniobacteraceae bacterium]
MELIFPAFFIQPTGTASAAHFELLFCAFIQTKGNHPMAVLLQITYSKKLGLPNFSSHSCSASVQVEIGDVSQVGDEHSRLYELLQSAVDKEIQHVGYLPDATNYGMHQSSNGNGQRNGNGNGHHGNGRKFSGNQNGDVGISEKQLDLVNTIVRENNANKADIEALAVEMFGGGVRTLNRMQASNFIDALFEQYPRKTNGSGSGRYQRPHRQAA